AVSISVTCKEDFGTVRAYIRDIIKERIVSELCFIGSVNVHNPDFWITVGIGTEKKLVATRNVNWIEIIVSVICQFDFASAIEVRNIDFKVTVLVAMIK